MIISHSSEPLSQSCLLLNKPIINIILFKLMKFIIHIKYFIWVNWGSLRLRWYPPNHNWISDKNQYSLLSLTWSTFYSIAYPWHTEAWSRQGPSRFSDHSVFFPYDQITRHSNDPLYDDRVSFAHPNEEMTQLSHRSDCVPFRLECLS